MLVGVFALECTRNMLNMDELHFVSNKKKEQFKFKENAGLYIVNTIATTKELEEKLK